MRDFSSKSTIAGRVLRTRHAAALAGAGITEKEKEIWEYTLYLLFHIFVI